MIHGRSKLNAADSIRYKRCGVNVAVVAWHRSYGVAGENGWRTEDHSIATAQSAYDSNEFVFSLDQQAQLISQNASIQLRHEQCQG